MNFKFNLGAKVKDKITGYEGVVRTRVDYLTGCNKYGVQSTVLESGKPAKWQYFDEDELKLVAKNEKLIKTFMEEKTESKKEKKPLGGRLENYLSII